MPEHGYVVKELDEIFDFSISTNSGLTKSFVNSNKGTVPVYGASQDVDVPSYGYIKDINNFNDKKCASIMSISVKEYNDILNKAREKVTKALIDKDEINIIDISVNEQPKCTTLCKFRCAVCGQIYEIDYTKEDIKCPLCLSSKIMTNEEAGFLK